MANKMKEPDTNGFTLAEVLITLGVIGVVAALTLPTVITNYQKSQTVTQLKKAYTTINQAYQMSRIDNNDFEYWESITGIGKENYFNKYWKPYLKILRYCDTYSDCGYSAKYPWTQPNGNQFDHGFTSGKVSFILPDNTLISINSSGYILIDLNGKQSPNIFGRDLFGFNIEKTHIKPDGTRALTVNRYCSNTRGETCAAKIIKSGWKIPDDYPW